MCPPKDKTSQTPLTQETLLGHITHRSLLMTGPAHICALHVSVRLPEQTSGSSSGLPREPTLLGILCGSTAHCPHRERTFLCPLRLPKTKVHWPSCFLQIVNIWPHGGNIPRTRNSQLSRSVHAFLIPALESSRVSGLLESALRPTQADPGQSALTRRAVTQVKDRWPPLTYRMWRTSGSEVWSNAKRGKR